MSSPRFAISPLTGAFLVAVPLLLLWVQGAEAGYSSVNWETIGKDIPLESSSDQARERLIALADTGDEVATTDTLNIDSLLARTFGARQPGVSQTGVSLFGQAQPRILGGPDNIRQRSVDLDSTELAYTIREQVGDRDVRAAARVGLEQFLSARRYTAVRDGFRSYVARQSTSQDRGGLGRLGHFKVSIPGGDQSAFRTIFGKNEVDLRINGTSNVDMAVRRNTNELQEAISNRGGVLAPQIGQEMNLNVVGTIGDKLKINVNYDTQNQFDFENQVSLVYTGYEDEILQRVEAGNVFLQTPSELIQGGQRLFGLRSDLQFGPLSLTAVASQQDAEEREIEPIVGGSSVSEYTIEPHRYENDTHFYLGYFFYTWWDEGHANPTNVTIPPNFDRIINLEVWKHDSQAATAQETDDTVIQAVALADLGEPVEVLEGGRNYLETNTNPPLPNPTVDQYDDVILDSIRTSSERLDILENTLDLDSRDFVDNRFRRLTLGVDYEFDPNLGWLSLTGGLSDNEILAVAYEYRTRNGDVVTVGDFGNPPQGNRQTDPRGVYKLLRNRTPNPTDATWDLALRNIYRVGGGAISQDGFSLELMYQRPGSTAQETLPRISFDTNRPLLQVLGLDRVNSSGQPPPDEEFDFLNGRTIDVGRGRVIFPVREPFGDHMLALLQGEGTFNGNNVDVSHPGISLEEAIDDFAFPDLYQKKPDVANRDNPKLSRYRIAGEVRGASQAVRDLGFNLVPGTVNVTSGGETLTEGIDYAVNYSQGTIEILNQAYLAEGRQIDIDVEQNQLFSIGSKTLLGLRGDYRFDENASLGATWMRLSERPIVEKFRIGEEALQNSIYGIDGRYEATPDWLTRAVDALPLIETRAESRFEFRGEVARLEPGVPETFAFRDVLRTAGDALYEDERQGISYIDDFEGSSRPFRIDQPGQWRLASAPPGTGRTEYNPSLGPFDPDIPQSWRGLFSWYTLSQEVIRDVPGINRATLGVNVCDLFPERQCTAEERRNLAQVLDVYFDPSRRGPYNYNPDLETTFQNNPREAWGGMSFYVNPAYSDFDGTNNIEFIEMLVAPIGGRTGNDPVTSGSALYIDLGQVSEDILPNGTLNSEDGIVDNPPSEGDLDDWGRPPQGQITTTVDFFEDTGRTEDLGLDGLPSRTDLTAGEPYEHSEQEHFQEFLNAVGNSSPEGRRAQQDPSGDDFHHFLDDAYFENETFFPNGATLQERFAHFFNAPEVNTAQSQREIVGSGQQGPSLTPNTEDLNDNFSLDRTESFWRYRIPLDADSLRQSVFFQDERVYPREGGGETWFTLRIPVRLNDREQHGSIEDFSRIENMRIWTNGHERPATLRFAGLQLVGSEWQKSERVGFDVDIGPRPANPGEGRMFVGSINNETDANRYEPAEGTLVNRAFAGTTGEQVEQREQALVFRVEDFADGQERAVFKPYTTKRIDLSKYTNLRLDVHGEGFERADSMRVFVRLGSDETEHYFEVEQPIYPFDSKLAASLGENPDPDSLWQTNVSVGGGERRDLNPVNILLSALNLAQIERDRRGEDPAEEYHASVSVLPDNAPPGARVSIRGTPSIQQVSTIVLGVRNAGDGSRAPLEETEFWFNELRVSGFDNQGGARGFLTTRVDLADLASVNGRLEFTQDGFGSLNDGLGDRSFGEEFRYTLSSSLNAHTLIPERFGWNIPVNFSLVHNESTPRFAPRNGSIRVSDLIDQAESDSTLSPEERQIQVDEVLASSQTVSSSRTVSVNVSKSRGQSDLVKYTLDALSASYSNSVRENRSPSQEFSDATSWRANLNYRLNVNDPKTVRPFWFVGDTPVLGSVLGGLRLNILPQRFQIGLQANRSMQENRERPDILGAEIPDEELSYRFPNRGSHSFKHSRTFDLSYRPLPFLDLTYRSSANQNLDRAGVDERFELFVRDEREGMNDRVLEYEMSRDSAFIPGSPLYDDLGISTQSEFDEIQDSLDVVGGQSPLLGIRPVNQVIGDLLAGDRRLITDSYNSNVSATLRISTNRIGWLNWLRLQPLTFSSNYTWNRTPISNRPNLTVASIAANVNFQTSVQIDMQELFRLLPFYRAMEEAEGNRSQAGGQGGQNQQAPDAQDPAGEDEIPEAVREAMEEEGQGLDAPEGEDAVPDREPERQEPSDPKADNVGGRPTPEPSQTGDDSTEASSGGGFNPLSILRRLVLGLTSARDLNIRYRGGYGSDLDGIEGTAISFPGAIFGDAPPLGFRLGLDRNVPLTERYQDVDQALRLQDVLGDQHTVEGSTNLQVLPSLRVSLSFQTDWNRNDVFPIEYDTSRTGLFQADPIRNGNGRSTVLSIGASYDDLLQRHRRRLDQELQGVGRAPGDTLESTFLSANAIAQDFRSTFARGFGSFGPERLFTIPVPHWDVQFTGLSSFPIFKSLTDQINLQHAYFSESRVTYQSAPENPRITPVDSIFVVPPASEANLEARTITVTEEFRPLVGTSITWKGGIQTDLRLNRGRTLQLSPNTAGVNERRTSDVELQVNYTKSGGFRLLGRRLQNTIRFSLTGSIATNETVSHNLRSDLTQEERQEDQVSSTKILRIWPELSYNVSRDVTVRLFARYDRTLTEGTSTPDQSTFDGGVAVRVSFSN